MLSIAQSIPPEVVREISPLFWVDFHVVKAFPWYLGHVFSLWRAELLSMKQEFWSEEIVMNNDRLEMAKGLLDMFLEHTGGVISLLCLKRWLLAFSPFCAWMFHV